VRGFVGRAVKIVLVLVLVAVAAACGTSHDTSSRASSGASPTTTTTTARRPTTSTTRAPSGGCPLPTTRPASTSRVLTLRRTPSAAAPIRATIVGDSIAQTLAPSIAVGFDQLTARTGIPHAEVQSAAEFGFGFASSLPGIIHGKADPGFPPFRDWQGLFDRAVVKYDPDVVIALVGSWDMVQRKVGGTYVDPSDCGWASWYRGLVDEAGRHLRANGAVVIWLSFPCTVQPENRLHFGLNDVFHAYATSHGRAAAYVDLDGFVCPHGKVVRRMTAPDGKSYRVRAADDTHFEFYGAPPVLGPFFADTLQRLLPLPR
jgi:hypothetical protein